jgi:hypothetical protein
MKELIDLENKLLASSPVSLREVKTTFYKIYSFPGVYIVYKNAEMLKIGKTSGKSSGERKENNLADRLCGLTYKDSVLRDVMQWPLVRQAEECLARCLRVEDKLLRGRLEYYLIAKYCPIVNQRELAR